MYRSLRFNLNSRSATLLPDFVFIHRQINVNASRIKEYYHNEPRMVSLRHPLYLMLSSLPVEYNGDKRAFVASVRSATLQIAKTHKLTHVGNPGIVHSTSFVPETSEEIIITHSTTFDVDAAIANWQDLQPVRVLRHPFGDIGMPVLNKSLSLDYFIYNHRVLKDKTYVFEVNVPMLALQYVCWLEATEVAKRKDNLGNFVAAFPLTNMITSWANVGWLNRYRYFLSNPTTKRYPTIRNVHPIAIALLENDLDNVLGKLRDRTQRITRDFSTTLTELSLPFDGGANDLLRSVNLYEDTRQVIWALNVAYLPLITTLLMVDQMAPTPTSWDIKRSLNINIARLRSGNNLRPYMPPALFVRADRMINDQVKPYV